MMCFKDFFKNIARIILIDELEARDQIRRERDSYKIQAKKLLKKHEEILVVVDGLRIKIREGWENPYRWPSIKSNYETIDGLRIPENVFIQFNDREIKKSIVGLKEEGIEVTAYNVEKYVSERVSYWADEKNSFHPGYKEFFQFPSMTWHSRMGDCDDMANLFASIMGMLGYKSEVVVCKGFVGWGDIELGHCWNKVLIDDVWVDFDSNARQIVKLSVFYPEFKSCWDFYNHYGVYRLGGKK